MPKNRKPVNNMGNEPEPQPDAQETLQETPVEEAGEFVAEPTADAPDHPAELVVEDDPLPVKESVEEGERTTVYAMANGTEGDELIVGAFGQAGTASDSRFLTDPDPAITPFNKDILITPFVLGTGTANANTSKDTISQLDFKFAKTSAAYPAEVNQPRLDEVKTSIFPWAVGANTYNFQGYNNGTMGNFDLPAIAIGGSYVGGTGTATNKFLGPTTTYSTGSTNTNYVVAPIWMYPADGRIEATRFNAPGASVTMPNGASTTDVGFNSLWINVSGTKANSGTAPAGASDGFELTGLNLGSSAAAGGPATARTLRVQGMDIDLNTSGSNTPTASVFRVNASGVLSLGGFRLDLTGNGFTFAGGSNTFTITSNNANAAALTVTTATGINPTITTAGAPVSPSLQLSANVNFGFTGGAASNANWAFNGLNRGSTWTITVPAAGGTFTFGSAGTLTLNSNTFAVTGGNVTLTTTANTTYRVVGDATNNQFLLSVTGSGSTYPAVAAGAIPFFPGASHAGMGIAAAGTATQVLIGGASPAFGALNLGTMVTGTVALANGGTGADLSAAGATAGVVFKASGTAFGITAAGTTSQVLIGGAAAPSWGSVSLTTMVSGILPTANGGTNSNITGSAIVDGDLLLGDATNDRFNRVSPGATVVNSTTSNASFVTLTSSASAFNLNVFAASTGDTGRANQLAAWNAGKLATNATSFAANELVTKAYVDGVASGLDIKNSVKAATTAALSATYSNGAAGVGATLTNSGVQAALALDGVSLALNDRVLIKNQGSTFQNGIYTVTTVGSASVNWVLTRAADADEPAELSPGAFVFVEQGTSQADTGWVISADSVAVIGTDPITYTQFSGAGSITVGRGLGQAGGTVYTLLDSNNGIQNQFSVIGGGGASVSSQSFAGTNDLEFRVQRSGAGTTLFTLYKNIGGSWYLTDGTSQLTVTSSGTLGLGGGTLAYTSNATTLNLAFSAATATTLNVAASATAQWNVQLSGAAFPVTASNVAVPWWFGNTYSAASLAQTTTANAILGTNSTPNGMEFKTLSGTTNRLSVTHGAGTITLNIDTNYAGQNTITTLGTVTTGTWNATLIGLQYGGTGADLTGAGATGGVVWKSSGTALGITAAGTAAQILRSNAATAPTWTNLADLITPGTGITESGTTTVTLSVDQAFSPTWTGQHTFTYAPATGTGANHTLSIQSVPFSISNGAVVEMGIATAFNGTASAFTGDGSVNGGTYFAIGAAANFAGDFLHFGVTDTSWATRFRVSATGAVTAAGGYFVGSNRSIDGISASGTAYGASGNGLVTFTPSGNGLAISASGSTVTFTLTNNVTGTGTQYQAAVWSGTNTLVGIGPGTANQVFVSGGGAANPQYVNISTLVGVGASLSTTGTTSITLSLNVGNANTWTALQTFNNGVTLGTSSTLTLGNTGGANGAALVFPSASAPSALSNGQMWWDGTALNFRSGGSTFNLLNTLSNGNTVTGGTAGAILYVNGSTQLAATDEENLYFDPTNKRVSIGGNVAPTPLNRLEVLNGGVLAASGPDSPATLGTGGIATGSTTGAVNISSNSGWPTAGLVLIDNEIIQYTATTATTMTIPGSGGRGLYGTTAAGHSVGASIYHIAYIATTASGQARILMLTDGRIAVGPPTTIGADGPIQVNVNGVGGGTNQSAGFRAINETAATSGVQVQNSPAIGVGGTVWDGAASNFVRWRMYATATGGSANGSLVFASEITTNTAVGAHTTRATLSNTGVFNATGGVQVNGNSVITSIAASNTMYGAITLAGAGGVTVTNSGNTVTITGSGGTIGGSGTTNRIAKFATGTTLSDSIISESANTLRIGQSAGTQVAIGGTSSFTGALNLEAATNQAGGIYFGTDTTIWRRAANDLQANARLYIQVTGAAITLKNNVVSEDSSSPITKLEIQPTGSATPTFSVDSAGNLKARTKSFDIEHPTKPGHRLVYGVLEGPEHGVYQRGHVEGRGTIQVQLPDYWDALTQDDYTVQLTPCGNYGVYIVEKSGKGFKVRRTGLFGRWLPVKVEYLLVAARKDAILVVEQPE